MPIPNPRLNSRTLRVRPLHRTTSATFIHAPLNHPRNFRILHLKNSLRGDSEEWKDQVLHGTLVENSLDDVPLYLALSYAWGDPSLSDVILIDERELKITQSCGAALRRMLKGNSEIMIWVDAICINQAGDTQAVQERNAQVALMDAIFNKAMQVNVHLGEGDGKTDEACKAVKKLATACRAALEAKRTGVEEETTRRKYYKVAEEVIKRSSEFPFGTLDPLFHLPWFRRVWVFQEVVLARKLVCYCGEHTFSFEDMVHAGDFTLVPYPKPDQTALYWRAYFQDHNWAIYQLRQQEQGEDTDVRYTDLLMTAAGLDTTRPEDKIYGMYGCAKRLGLDWPTPDYTKSVAQIYTEATVACFRQDKDLEIMNLAMGPAVGGIGLPSWVPEFSGSYNTPSLSKPPRLPVRSPGDKQCSGASQCGWNFIPDGRHLKVKGRRFDYIAAVGEPWGVISLIKLPGDTKVFGMRYQNCERFINSIGSWFGVILQRNKIRDGSTNLADEFLATSDLADLLASASAGPQILESHDEIVKNISLTVTYTGKSHEDLLTLHVDRGDDNITTIGQFSNSMCPFGWQLVFRTENNLCMGTSNCSAKAGDLLVIFHGMDSPCVIRPCAGGFNFIGRAFVEGTLDGVFWEGGSNEDDEWFTLM